MENNQVYSMACLESSAVVKDATLFLMAYDGEERAYYSWNYLIENGAKYENVAILTYNEEHLQANKELTDSISKNKGVIYNVPNEQIAFVACLKNIDFQNMESIIIDISSMRTMHIFLLLKYLKLINCSKITVINTIPYDYIFRNEPFLSYRSYVGDLELKEITGYSGRGEMSQDSDLYIFMGFEGSLSLKVVEDTAFKNLYLINTIPSYYQKYKDISVINNYSVLQLKKNRVLHAPADNPFEVYNVLDSKISKDKMVCIAPLSTKPISLGICLYALEHENVRVVYPVSNAYNDIKSHDVYISYVYEINI